MGDSLLLFYISLVVVFLFWLLKSANVMLSHIPTVGSPGFLGPYWAAIKFFVNGAKYLQQGYNQYKPRPFRVLTLYGWMVILNREHLEDIANTGEPDLSFNESVKNTLQVEYTLGSEVHHNPYHLSIIQAQLNRNLASLCPDIADEMVNAFREVLDIMGNEWKAVHAFQAVCQVVSRTSCDPGWNDFTIELAAAVVKEALMLCAFPAFIVPWVARYVTGLCERTRKGTTYLGPIIQERQKHMDKYASKEWSNKPNDFLQWCLDAGKESSIILLVQRIMTMNFAAIHTTSNTFTQALYHLAANPQYAILLREEVDTIIGEHGWTKEALGKMRRVDSFLKETLRHEGIGLERKALKDIKLSDGTFLPKGTFTRVATNGIHLDPGVYDNADVFEPFRFTDLEGDREGYKSQLVSVSSDSLAFGYGKMACPGRFFAAVLLKMMLAYIASSLDVKLDESGPQPKNLVSGHAIVADPKARVMFRKRSD